MNHPLITTTNDNDNTAVPGHVAAAAEFGTLLLLRQAGDGPAVPGSVVLS